MNERSSSFTKLFLSFTNLCMSYFIKCFFFAAVDCGPLPVPRNGSLFGEATVFPNSLRFSCHPGFILHGSSIRTCRPTGNWSGTKASCTGK